MQVVFSKHLYFTDLARVGCQVENFNLMRDPVERFVSRYNFNRELLAAAQSEDITGQKREMSSDINSCVLDNHTECSYTGVLHRYHKLFRLVQ